MEAEFNHLNHATWECKYHVVFTPKYRKKLLFGKIKRHHPWAPTKSMISHPTVRNVDNCRRMLCCLVAD